MSQMRRTRSFTERKKLDTTRQRSMRFHDQYDKRLDLSQSVRTLNSGSLGRKREEIHALSRILHERLKRNPDQ